MARGFSTTLGVATTDLVLTGPCPAANQRTYSIWYNGRTLTGSPRLWYDANQMLQFNVSPFQLFFTRGFSTTSGVWSITGGTQATTGVWNHFVIQFDNSTTADPLAWINGQPATVAVNTAPSGTPNAIATQHYLGNRSAGDRVFDGLVGDFALWNAFLNTAQILDLYKGERPDNIARTALAEWIDMQSGRPISRAGRAPPTFVGTKIRPDFNRFNEGQINAWAFAGAQAATLSGNAGITFGQSGALASSVSASSSLTFGTSANLADALGGSSAITFGASSALASTLSGTSVLALAASGALGSSVAGASAIIFGSSGTLQTTGISGNASLAFQASGTLTNDLAGSAALSLSASATLDQSAGMDTHDGATIMRHRKKLREQEIREREWRESRVDQIADEIREVIAPKAPGPEPIITEVVAPAKILPVKPLRKILTVTPIDEEEDEESIVLHLIEQDDAAAAELFAYALRRAA